jgi:hypothetical protein
MQQNKDYHALTRNCQHLAKALAEEITGQTICPMTITDLLRPLMNKVLGLGCSCMEGFREVH